MTDQEFDLGYQGDPIRTADGSKRLRHIVAEELRRQASICQKAGRLDKASRIRWAAGQIEIGKMVTKKVHRMISKEVQAAKEALVDGVQLVDWSQER